MRDEHETAGFTSVLLTLEAPLVAGALILHGAAIRLCVRAGHPSDERRAITMCASLQAELLRSGWENVLRGCYAAGLQPVRIIRELSEYILAASLSASGARLLLTREWKFREACRVVDEFVEHEGLELRATFAIRHAHQRDHSITWPWGQNE